MGKFFGALDITITDNDSMFLAAKFPQFCNGRTIALHTFIACHSQSLGATARRHRYFTYITHQILDKRTQRKIESVDRGAYSPVCMMRANSKVRQYDGFTLWRRVLGWAPELPIAAGYPAFSSFYEPNRFRGDKNTRCVCEIERNTKSVFRKRIARGDLIRH